MKAREWIDQGLNKYPNLMDLLEDFPLQDGEMETRDMRTGEQRAAANTRAPPARYCMSNSLKDKVVWLYKNWHFVICKVAFLFRFDFVFKLFSLKMTYGPFLHY